MRDEVVAAAFLELGGEVGSPVRTIDFEGVGEDGVGGLAAEGSQEWGGYIIQMFVDRGAGEVVENEAFSSYCWAFNDLFCVACDEEEGSAGNGSGRDLD